MNPLLDRGAVSRRNAIVWGAGVLGLGVIAVLLALFQPWQLFTTTEVHEALPAAVATATPSPSPSETSDTSATPSPTAAVTPSPAVSASPPATPSPIATPGELGRGTFVSYEHQTKGIARLLRLADGALAVRLEGFSTSNGPDVRVWLSDRRADAASDAGSGRWLDLGPLRGNRGELTYSVPAATDPSGYRSVVIWCRRFSVAFGAAPVTG